MKHRREGNAAGKKGRFQHRVSVIDTCLLGVLFRKFNYQRDDK